MGNQVSMIITDLPTDVADPLERIKAVHESMMTGQGGARRAAGGDDHRVQRLRHPAISAAAACGGAAPTLTSGVMPNVTIPRARCAMEDVPVWR